MRNRNTKTKDNKEKAEYMFFFGFYTIVLILNLIFAVSSQTWSALSTMAVISVAISLWYFPDH